MISFSSVYWKKWLNLKKIEGDKKTPKGIFEIENLYYRNDRINYLTTNLKCINN